MVIVGPADDMIAHLAALRMTNISPEPWNGEMPEIKIYRDGSDIVWHLEYSDWKFYPQYRDVQELLRIYSDSVDHPELSGYQWRFGEDDEDTEEDQFGGDLEFSITKSLDWNLPSGDIYSGGIIGGDYFVLVGEIDSSAKNTNQVEAFSNVWPEYLRPFIHYGPWYFHMAAVGLPPDVADALMATAGMARNKFRPALDVSAARGITQRKTVGLVGSTYVADGQLEILISRDVTHQYQDKYASSGNLLSFDDTKEKA